MLSPERENKLPGYAIGGLSGGEEKGIFWKMSDGSSSSCSSVLTDLNDDV